MKTNLAVSETAILLRSGDHSSLAEHACVVYTRYDHRGVWLADSTVCNRKGPHSQVHHANALNIHVSCFACIMSSRYNTTCEAIRSLPAANDTLKHPSYRGLVVEQNASTHWQLLKRKGLGTCEAYHARDVLLVSLITFT